MNEFYGDCCNKGCKFYNGKLCQSFRLYNEEFANDFVVVIVTADTNVDWDIENGNHLYVSGEMNEQGEVIAEYVDRWGRYCSHCGKHHEEGYWIDEYQYACSEECAIALLGSKEALDKAKEEYDDDADYNPICWVEWYN